MSLIPDPDSLLELMLVWLGVPTVVVVALMTGMTVMEYLRHLMFAGRAARRAGHRVVAMFDREPARVVLSVGAGALSQGLLVAMTYALVRLAEVTFAEGLDDGRLYDTSDVLNRMLDYDAWTPISSNAVLGALVLMAILNLGIVSNTNWMCAVGLLPLVPVAVGCLVLAAISIVPGLFVVGLGLGRSDGYTVEMSLLYAIWIGALAGWAASAYLVEGSATRVGKLLSS